MNRLLPSALWGFLLLALLAGGWVSHGLANPAQDNELKNSPPFCPMGQGWVGYDPDWIDPGAITGGGQTFYALFDPDDYCDCPVGFDMTTITFYMTLPDESTYPLILLYSMGLREAIPDPSGRFTWLPGPDGCHTPIRQDTVLFPKLFLGYGSAVECDCFEMGSPAFLSFTVHTDLELPGGLLTAGGGTPGFGRYLTQVDGQWVDLVEAGILTRGPLVISGSTQCCEPPVGATSESWGTLKALYH